MAGMIVNPFASRAPILMLHRVLEKYDSNNYYFQRGTAISWQCFSRWVAWAVSCREQGLPVPVFTFDDGYVDNYRAIVELLKFDVPVVLSPVRDFVVTGFSPIDDMAARLNEGEFKVSHRLHMALLGGKLKACLAALDAQQYRLYRQRWFAITDDAPKNQFLSEIQLCQLVSLGLQLGVHGVSHRVWTALSTAELHAEIQHSFSWLASLGCKQPVALCMPHGKIDQSLYSILQRYRLPLLGVDRAYPFAVTRRLWVKEDTEI